MTEQGSVELRTWLFFMAVILKQTFETRQVSCLQGRGRRFKTYPFAKFSSWTYTCGWATM